MCGILVTSLLASLCSAREITFPPVAAVQFPLRIESQLDISQPIFAGLTTYANTPYVHCLAADGEKVEPYDIAILGAPFDTVRRLLFGSLAICRGNLFPLDQCIGYRLVFHFTLSSS